MVRFSIIIPHYDIPELLMRCLRSIPVREDIQTIIVDDNSPGADTYMEKYPELSRPGVEFILTPGGGSGYARNVGLDRAKGEWLIFADADDFFTEDFGALLDKYGDAAEDVLFFRSRCVLSDHPEISSENLAWVEKFFASYRRTKDDTDFRCLYHTPWGKLYKRSLICKHQIRFPEIYYGADLLFMVAAHCEAASVRICDEYLYTYTVREGSLTDRYCEKPGELESRLTGTTAGQKMFTEAGYHPSSYPAVNLLLKAYRTDRKIFRKHFPKVAEAGLSRGELARMLRKKEHAWFRKAGLLFWTL